MKLQLNTEPTLYRPEHAATLAAELSAGDDWSYVVDNPAGPWTRIAIYDGEELVGFWKST